MTIPAHLLPDDGRFGAGPSLVRDSQLEAVLRLNPSVVGTSHRQPPVRDLVARVRRMTAELFDAPAGYEVVLGNGGSTLFWDAATFQLIDDRAQFAHAGEFGAKFAAAGAAAPWLSEPDMVTSEPGTGVGPRAGAGIDTYAWVQNETSTGVVNPVRRVAGADAGALMLVDATSAAGGVAIDLAQTDAYYFAPQKSFASDGGLWLALLSPAALERIERLSSRWVPQSLSLAAAVKNSRLEQTLNTPAIVTLALLAEQLDWMFAGGGLPFAVERSAASAATLYGWAESSTFARPWVTSTANRSPVVGTIDFDEGIDAKSLAATLRANGIVDTEPYRKLGRNQLRIGMYPAVAPADVEALTACIDYVVERL
ncbi:phosphoserine transaminase [Pseudactinotalea sp. HY158]|uniref:phosphoserine transaminase n=1 Tax=Pseudactinotalea sp. HY158 TaxID=2654547 RepID=UPI00129C9228|nr:phosphoserine transaminase [Pseudactinotalea sp. HY158]QGH70897.1 phosphoserine transaminase [Pseudactinotalea sp. HY158]